MGSAALLMHRHHHHCIALPAHPRMVVASAGVCLAVRALVCCLPCLQLTVSIWAGRARRMDEATALPLLHCTSSSTSDSKDSWQLSYALKAVLMDLMELASRPAAMNQQLRA